MLQTGSRLLRGAHGHLSTTLCVCVQSGCQGHGKGQRRTLGNPGACGWKLEGDCLAEGRALRPVECGLGQDGSRTVWPGRVGTVPHPLVELGPIGKRAPRPCGGYGQSDPKRRPQGSGGDHIPLPPPVLSSPLSDACDGSAGGWWPLTCRFSACARTFSSHRRGQRSLGGWLLGGTNCSRCTLANGLAF